MDRQGQQERNNRRRYVGSGRLTQQNLENITREQEQSQWSQEVRYNQPDSQIGSTRRPYVGSGRLPRQHLDNITREQERYNQPQHQNYSPMPPGQRQASPQDDTTAPQRYALTNPQFYQFQPRYNISVPPAQRPAAENIDCTPAIREQMNRSINSPPSQECSANIDPIADAFSFFTPSSEPLSTQPPEKLMSSIKIEENEHNRALSVPPAPQLSTPSTTYQVSPFTLQKLAPTQRDNSPPKICKSPTRSPERQPALAEASPSVADAKKHYYQKSVNLQPTGAQESTRPPAQLQSQQAGAYSQLQTHTFTPAAAHFQREGLPRGMAQTRGTGGLMTPADFYVKPQSSVSATAQSQKEESSQRRARERARKCLMTPADFYLEKKD